MKLKLHYRIAIKLIDLLSRTWLYKFSGIEPESNGIVAFWHGYMLSVWKYFSKNNPYAIVSQSNDGEILSQLLSRWNYRLIRGSSAKGSKMALQEITEHSKTDLVLITPDGPTGPYHEFKAGAVIASQRASTPLYLCKVKARNKIIFNKSWDKFEVPFLFAKIELLMSNPILVNSDASRVEIDEIILNCMKNLNEEN